MNARNFWWVRTLRVGKGLFGTCILPLALLLPPTPSLGEEDLDSTSLSEGGQGYVAEIVDSVHLVGPAKFFALDLPPDPPGVRAVHLLGTVTVTDRKGDIQVRLFRPADYQGWLKKRGGEKAEPFWTSKRARSITLDQDLSEIGPCVILLDNGYSMRSKHLRAQLQIQYQRVDSAASATDSETPTGSDLDDDFVIPRANTEEETPPPPPPPPDEETK